VVRLGFPSGESSLGDNNREEIMAKAPKVIRDLVEKFDRNIEYYKSAAFDEEDVRQEFLNPLFAALGWNIANTGLSPDQREVIHEYRSKAARQRGTPDYAFRTSKGVEFFVEAKRPSVDLEHDKVPAVQLRNYGWNAKLPVCLLTDFEEFCVFDCSIPISPKDSAETALRLRLGYLDYVEKWDEIAGIFSKEAVLNGSLEKFAKSKKRKRVEKQVDDVFLEDMEHWRKLLATNIHKNNTLTSRELNYAVQQIIDRILFLRMCEDRGIERIAQLQGLTAGPRIYPRMVEIFEAADAKYNSGLFHFSREKGRVGSPDSLTPGLVIEDKVLKKIISTLYDDKSYSKYNFAIIPPEILGHVYEQFLGKTIRMTPKRVYIEDKPEVRKAGGVYYTPRYIVDYIVENTVGKLCKGKDAKKLSEIRVLDPSCGSGSFLLSALQHLYDVHLRLYVSEMESTGKVPTSPPPKGKRRKKSDPPAIYQVGDSWLLTTAEKKRILVNNIFGVDIDRQAVEVTKLSLLLKVLENENQDTLNSQLTIWRERALPDLSNNIKCGNSLIGPDFYRGAQIDLLDEDTEQRINVFDWKNAFLAVFSGDDPGFDTVIGNPPYIRIQHMKEWAPVEVEFYKESFHSARKGNYDIYVVFVEQSLALLNQAGRLGYILPHKFFNAKYGEGLRGLLAGGRHIERIIHFGDQQIFESATNYTCLLFLSKKKSRQIDFSRVTDLDAWRTEETCERGKIKATTIAESEWNFAIGPGTEVFDALSKWPVKLSDIAERIAQGIRTSANEVYVLDLVRESGRNIVAHSKILDREVKLERKAVSLFLQGREIKPYRVLPSGKVVIAPYTIQNGRANLIPEAEIKKKFPLLHAYLNENKEYLSSREKGRFRGAEWFQYGRQQNIDLTLLPKILVPDIADRASFALDETGGYAFTSGYGITMREEVEESEKYILALLNSSLLDFYLKRISTTMRGGFFRYFTQFVKRLPIRTINQSDKREKKMHDRMVSLVDRMLELNKQLPETRTPHEKEALQRRIDATDAQIDKLVYELYGLTEKDVKIVEEAIGGKL
jgi:type I restriction-modification system DNA methylase subunit